MNADTGRRYRLYPNPEEAERLTAWGHTCRAMWNVALERRQSLYSQRGITLRARRQCRHLTEARAELDWIADLPAQAAQQVLAHLDRAYDSWWNPHHPAGPPRFKKRGAHLSVSSPGQAVATRKLSHRAAVQLPKLGWIKLRLSRPLGGSVRNVTVSRDALGWHIAFGESTESRPRLMRPTLTDGENRRLVRLERRKARQVQWARKHNQGQYSRRLRRAITEIAGLKARQARRRSDFTHKLTTDPAKSHGWVGVENLQVKNLTASAQGIALAPGRDVKAKAALNRRILDSMPGERRRQLEYKAAKFGSELRLVPAVRDPKSRPGCGRELACSSRGHHEHADRNAAQNIEALAAGRAVNGTRSHLQVARPTSHTREPQHKAPLETVAPQR